MANNDASNIKLGTCQIKFGGVDLGFTMGGVEATVETSTHTTQIDQHGDTPVNERITGRTVKVNVPLAETTLENLVAIMPGSTLVTDSVDANKKKVVVSTGIGTSLLDSAQELVLRPIDKVGTDDASEDFTVFLANTPGGMSFAYKIDEERVYNTEFTGYPDIANNGNLFSYGDNSATP